jgi:hypothetical protein
MGSVIVDPSHYSSKPIRLKDTYMYIESSLFHGFPIDAFVLQSTNVAVDTKNTISLGKCLLGVLDSNPNNLYVPQPNPPNPQKCDFIPVLPKPHLNDLSKDYVLLLIGHVENFNTKFSAKMSITTFRLLFINYH